MLRADGTRKPAYDALERLIKGEWWMAPTRLRTDPDGRAAVRGFRGDYTVTADGRTATFPVDS